MTLSLLLVVDTLLSRNAALEFGGRAGSLVQSVSDALLPEVRNELLHQLSLPDQGHQTLSMARFALLVTLYDLNGLKMVPHPGTECTALLCRFLYRTDLEHIIAIFAL